MPLSASVLYVACAITGLFAFLLIGNYTLGSIPLGGLSFIFSFLIGIRLSCNGNRHQLRFALSISSLLAVLSLINFLLRPYYFQQESLMISMFLICASPLIGWAYLNFRIASISSKKLLFINLFLSLQYYFINSLAGPNVTYKYAAFSLFISIYFLATNSKRILVPGLIKSINILFPALFFWLLIAEGSRGGIFTFLILFLILILSKLNFHALKSIDFAKLKISSLRNAFILIALLLLLPAATNAFSTRAYLFFIYFIDPQKVLSISKGTELRQDWYGALFNYDILSDNTSVFSPENTPFWGTYPHNFILDTLGNLGLLFTLLSLISAVVIVINLSASLANIDAELSVSSLAYSVIIFSSLVSGTLWDYYSIFAGLALLPACFSGRALVDKR